MHCILPVFCVMSFGCNGSNTFPLHKTLSERIIPPSFWQNDIKIVNVVFLIGINKYQIKFPSSVGIISTASLGVTFPRRLVKMFSLKVNQFFNVEWCVVFRFLAFLHTNTSRIAVYVPISRMFIGRINLASMLKTRP
jgi:hypothetical protein